jgi:hypothetical protein
MATNLRQNTLHSYGLIIEMNVLEMFLKPNIYVFVLHIFVFKNLAEILKL